MKTKIINVTQRHIDRAKELEKTMDEDMTVGCEICPVSLAVNAAFHKKVGFAKTTLSYIAFNGKKYLFPYEVRLFIYRFDLDKSVHPFSFKVEY